MTLSENVGICAGGADEGPRKCDDEIERMTPQAVCEAVQAKKKIFGMQSATLLPQLLPQPQQYMHPGCQCSIHLHPLPILQRTFKRR